MKLDRPTTIALFACACALGAAGCGSRAPAKVQAAPLVITPVGTATLEAAELGAPEDAPHVGKSQRSLSDGAADVPKGEDEPRRSERRPGGGFSGYK